MDLSNQGRITIEQQHSQQHKQQDKQRKKSHGNRKLQRYRRKLRKQGMSANDIACMIAARVDVDNSSKSTEIMKETIGTATTPVVNDTKDFPQLTETATNEKNNKKTNKNMKIKKNSSPSTHTNNEVNNLSTTTTDHSLDYRNVPDEIFCQMLLIAFNSTDKLDHYFFNENEKIEFVRHYTSLISRLSYLKLQQSQWDWYHHIGITQNIWTNRIPKHVAEKNSICHVYGRSKTMIERRRKQIQQQLQQVETAIGLFQQQILLKSTQHIDCLSEMKLLFSILNKFVGEHQEKLKDEFEYQRQILILDSTDHRLMRAFYDLKPNKALKTSARRIWKLTAQQTMIDEQITILHHRLMSKQAPAASTLLDHMIDNIDEILLKYNDSIKATASTTSISPQLEKIDQLKHDIINQSIVTGLRLIDNYVETVLNEKQKYCFNKSLDESKYEKQIAVLNAIDTRRLHMIERARYIIKQKLTASSKNNSPKTTHH